jgi:hypothetical protein
MRNEYICEDRRRKQILKGCPELFVAGHEHFGKMECPVNTLLWRTKRTE